MSTVRQADRIFVLGHGEMLEEGTHDELLAIPNGVYARLWSIQSGQAEKIDDTMVPEDDRETKAEN